MINKQSLWFVTLFSLIIVLSVYYFQGDQTSLNVSNSLKSTTVKANSEKDSSISVLKVANDELTVGKINELQSILLDEQATLEEKNNAYDELEKVNNTKAKEDEIKKYIKEKFKYDSFVKITDEQISIVIEHDVHNNESANKIIREVQNMYEENMYITVKFTAK